MSDSVTLYRGLAVPAGWATAWLQRSFKSYDTIIKSLAWGFLILNIMDSISTEYGLWCCSTHLEEGNEFANRAGLPATYVLKMLLVFGIIFVAYALTCMMRVLDALSQSSKVRRLYVSSLKILSIAAFIKIVAAVGFTVVNNFALIIMFG